MYFDHVLGSYPSFDRTRTWNVPVLESGSACSRDRRSNRAEVAVATEGAATTTALTTAAAAAAAATAAAATAAEAAAAALSHSLD